MRFPIIVRHKGRTGISAVSSSLAGMRTMTTAGDVNIQVGMASHVYLVTRSMADSYFYSADSELLIVPQEVKLRFCTELGVIDLEPKEIAIIPRGLVYRVELVEGPARGFVCENYGQKFELPGRGPIGANCLANRRDFKTPVAYFEDTQTPSSITVKWCGQFHECEIGHSPLDIVAWHGNYAPVKYDLRMYCPVGSILFDIWTAHIHRSDRTIRRTWHGKTLCLSERWLVTADTFRPRTQERHVGIMGNIYGAHDANLRALCLRSCIT